VGREHELGVLAEARRRARAGRRQLVVVTGEAGIGKTSFCEQVSAAAERDGFDVVRGRCWPHEGAPALWPWPAMLSALVGKAGAGLLATDSDQVEPERFARFDAVARLLTEARGRVPTMIVIDDAQHADASALRLTRFLADSLSHLPLVLLLATRDSPVLGAEPAESPVDEFWREATTIDLRPFDLDDTAALLAAQGRPGLDRARLATLHRITAGSPIHLVRAVERGWSGSGQDTVEWVIGDAVGRLSAPQRRILSCVALLGGGVIEEVARVAEAAPELVLSALRAAAEAGLVQPVQDRYDMHDVIAQVVLGQFDVVERLDAHARAAVVLAGTGQSERAAHHALAAAARSAADARRAIAACRAAAEVLRRGFGYEPAAELLGRAATLSAQVLDLSDQAEVLVEHADAVLACGRLGDARVAYEAAAEVAERAAAPVPLARAVLGLSGVWVHEHRNAAVRHEVLARQRAGLAALPDGARSLRFRLGMRLAAEAVYEGAPAELVLEALAEARTFRDDQVLAEALSLIHQALSGPEHAAARLRLAEEQLAVASAAGDGILALFGVLWRTIDLYLLGDPEADRSLAALRQRRDTLGVATVGYMVGCVNVMRLIRAGRLDEAEDTAGRCLRLGLEIGDPDATGYYGVQLLTIRWLQGRDAEMADAVVGTLKSGDLARDEQTACRVSAVMALARGGRGTEARATLLPLLRRGLADLPASSSWLASMVMIVEAARLLDDVTLAADAADLLQPFAELPAMATLAVSCFGSVSRSLGLAALMRGEGDSAVTHLERALAANVRLDHRPAAAITRAQLADALDVRAAPGDLARARVLLAEAVRDARTMGMHRRVDRWTEQAAALERTTRPVVLRRRGNEGWSVTGDATRIDLPDLVGLHYLSRLLEYPGREFAATELHGAVEVGTGHQLLDDVAVAAYRQRVRDIDTMIDDAEATGHPGKAERLRQERDAVAGELTRALGLGGRARTFAAPAERARSAVQKAIRRAIDTIRDRDPSLGSDLRRTVSTGTGCSYQPGERRWRVELG
jgi:hypothetical protein